MEMRVNTTDVQPSGAFMAIVKQPLKFRAFMVRQLPAAWLSGLKLVHVDAESCVISIPYRWFTRNPFRSVYFACLSMAAEMSTGILAMSRVYKSHPAVSLLVIAVEGKFHKKAVGITRFTCPDGRGIGESISNALATGEAQMFRAYSCGRNDAGEMVAEFWITWSFKRKN